MERRRSSLDLEESFRTVDGAFVGADSEIDGASFPTAFSEKLSGKDRSKLDDIGAADEDEDDADEEEGGVDVLAQEPTPTPIKAKRKPTWRPETPKPAPNATTPQLDQEDSSPTPAADPGPAGICFVDMDALLFGGAGGGAPDGSSGTHGRPIPDAAERARLEQAAERAEKGGDTGAIARERREKGGGAPLTAAERARLEQAAERAEKGGDTGAIARERRDKDKIRATEDPAVEAAARSALRLEEGPCTSLEEKKECDAREKCEWNPRPGNPKKGICEDQGGNVWRGACRKVHFPKNQTKEQEVCESISKPIEPDLQMCEWVVDNATRIALSMGPGDSKCTLNGDSDYVDSDVTNRECGNYTTAEICGMYEDCSWDKAMKLCTAIGRERKCKERGTEKSCHELDKCIYHTEKKTCVQKENCKAICGWPPLSHYCSRAQADFCSQNWQCECDVRRKRCQKKGTWLKEFCAKKVPDCICELHRDKCEWNEATHNREQSGNAAGCFPIGYMAEEKRKKQDDLYCGKICPDEENGCEEKEEKKCDKDDRCEFVEGGEEEVGQCRRKGAWRDRRCEERRTEDR